MDSPSNVFFCFFPPRVCQRPHVPPNPIWGGPPDQSYRTVGGKKPPGPPRQRPPLSVVQIPSKPVKKRIFCSRSSTPFKRGQRRPPRGPVNFPCQRTGAGGGLFFGVSSFLMNGPPHKNRTPRGVPPHQPNNFRPNAPTGLFFFFLASQFWVGFFFKKKLEPLGNLGPPYKFWVFFAAPRKAPPRTRFGREMFFSFFFFPETARAGRSPRRFPPPARRPRAGRPFKSWREVTPLKKRLPDQKARGFSHFFRPWAGFSNPRIDRRIEKKKFPNGPEKRAPKEKNLMFARRGSDRSFLFF